LDKLGSKNGGVAPLPRKPQGFLDREEAPGLATARSTSASFEESARVMDALGADEAVNFDGGGSTSVTVGERPIGDAVVLLP